MTDPGSIARVAEISRGVAHPCVVKVRKVKTSGTDKTITIVKEKMAKNLMEEIGER